MVRVMVFESKHTQQKDRNYMLMCTDSVRDWADLKKHYPVLLNYTWLNDFQSSEMYFPKQLMNVLFPTDMLTQQLADASTKIIKEQEEEIKKLSKESDNTTKTFKNITDMYDKQIADLNGTIKDLQAEISKLKTPKPKK